MFETCLAGWWLPLSPPLASNATNIQPDTPAEFPPSQWLTLRFENQPFELLRKA